MAPEVLQDVLRQLNGWDDPAVLVGYQTADDAAVYQLSQDLVLVQSVDFFTPVVDDPFQYGQIAAANALSDIYAMGGQPRFALSVVGFPKRGLDTGILREIIEGGTDKLREARVAVVGGHSVQDPEIKFGYCVTGTVHPGRYWTNAGAQPGDALVLTKPVGTGIITTGVKFEKTPPDVLQAALKVMMTLNAAAAQAASGFHIHGATDITGFGLIGHAFELARASKVSLRIQSSRVPLIEGTQDLARMGMLPGGIESNRTYVGKKVSWISVNSLMQQILLDPQTSGGLLLSLPKPEAPELLKLLKESDHQAAVIGDVREADAKSLLEVID